MIDRYPVRIDPLERMGWIDLYLPDDYYASDRRYPVLYMFDGQNLFFDQQAAFGYSWRLKRFLDTCDNPCIVVGLECDPKDQNRLHEYTPYPLPHTFFGRTIGAGAVLMEWIVQFLKPRIDAGLRTWPQREATAIAGSSMGGLMAFFAAVRHNNIFIIIFFRRPPVFPLRYLSARSRLAGNWKERSSIRIPGFTGLLAPGNSRPCRGWKRRCA